MSTIVHFDIPADKPRRAAEFYESLFGWKTSAMKEFPNHFEVMTTGSGGKPELGGGISKRDPHDDTPILVFIGVASIERTCKKVEELGGRVVLDRQPVPGYGFTALCMDTEENVFGLFEEEVPLKQPATQPNEKRNE